MDARASRDKEGPVIFNPYIVIIEVRKIMKGHDGAALIHVAEAVARHDEEADAVDIRDSPQDDIRGEAAIVVDYGIDLTVLNHYDPGPVGSDGNPAVRQFG